MTNRTGPRYYTSYEARQLAKKKFWVILIGMIGGALFIGGVIISFAGMFMAEPPYIATFIAIGPYFLTLMTVGSLMMWFSIRTDRFVDPAIKRALDTTPNVFKRGDHLADMHDSLLVLEAARMTMFQAYGPLAGEVVGLALPEPRTRPDWYSEMESAVEADWKEYKRRAQDLHEGQCALLAPFYEDLGKPNPLRENPT